VRWACLFVLLRLIEHLLRAREDWLDVPEDVEEEGQAGFMIPPITEADWLLALFPIPESPIATPIHKDISRITQETWVTRYLQPNGIKLGHVLKGEGWDGENRFGLSQVDRRILFELAQDINVNWSRASEMTERLWGSLEEARS